MTDKDVMEQALQAIEFLIESGLDEYTYGAVMSDPEHFVNRARDRLMEALRSKED